MVEEDFLIVEVRYNEERDHISLVRAHKIIGDKAKEKTTHSRENVVNALKTKKVAISTGYIDENGIPQIGAPIEIFELDEVEYIRTVGNETVCDNLGELPEF